MRDVLRASLAVLRAYFTAELVRSRGLVYGLLSLAVWISVFVVPTTLFSEGGAAERVAGGVLVGVAVFLAYSTATWDWAMLLRWLVQLGVLEYVLASGSPIISHFIGMIPVSLAWYSIALCIVYAVISLFVGPPRLVVLDPIALAIGIVTLLLVLLAYALLVGGALLTSGTSGPVVELVSWILPLATGGFFPVRSMPDLLQVVAYLTPFSYPAELIRYSLGVSEPLVDVGVVAAVGLTYAILFLAASAVFLRVQLRKVLKEGVKSVALF